MAPVKPQTSTKTSRRDRARATRQRIIAAAYDRFCANGYAGTTMADVASDAAVAVQTVYFTFHTKADLLAGAYEYAVLGADDPRPPDQQPWYAEAKVSPDIESAVRAITTGTTEITARATPLESVVRATAASDPDAARVWEHHERLRAEGYRGIVSLFTTKAPLKEGLSLVRATQLVLLYIGPHTYRGLVIDYGWSHDEYVAWAVEAILRDVFGREPGAD
jgi:AcrR family transcriptional regulator